MLPSKELIFFEKVKLSWFALFVGCFPSQGSFSPLTQSTLYFLFIPSLTLRIVGMCFNLLLIPMILLKGCSLFHRAFIWFVVHWLTKLPTLNLFLMQLGEGVCFFVVVCCLLLFDVKKNLSQMEADLYQLLELVGVSYLVERSGGWDQRYKWEDVLSLGEQQRIGVARLFYHHPQYGVLDECTSAVSLDVEERLYQQAAKLGITCITISQRLALQVCSKR